MKIFFLYLSPRNDLMSLLSSSGLSTSVTVSIVSCMACPFFVSHCSFRRLFSLSVSKWQVKQHEAEVLLM